MTQNGSIRPRGKQGIRSLRYRLDGRMREKSLKTCDPAEAEARAAPIMQKVRLLERSSIDSPNAKRPATFQEAATREIQRLETDVSRAQGVRASFAFQAFVETIGNPALEHIDAAFIERFQRRRLRVAARSTVEKELFLVLRMLRENKIEIRKPSPKEGRRARRRPFVEAELVRFFRACPDRYRALCAFLLATGARPCEAYRTGRSAHVPLLKSEVNVQAGSVLIRTAKGRIARAEERPPRLLAVSPDVMDLLIEEAERTPGEYVFPRFRHFATEFNKILKAAKIEKVNARGYLDQYCFRHTNLTWQAPHLDVHSLMAAAGHSRITTTQNYVRAACVVAPALHVGRKLRLAKSKKRVGKSVGKKGTKPDV